MKYFLKRGFTLIELMVVIAIIGILASIIIVSLSSSKAKGRDAKRVSDIRTIQLALEEYYNDNGSYPTSLNTAPFNTTYLAAVPQDPLGASNNWYDYKYTSYLINSFFPTGHANCTSAPKLPNSYQLAAVTECNSNSGPSCPTYPSETYAGVFDSDIACNGGSGPFDGTSVNCANTTQAGIGVGDNCYMVKN